MSHWLLKTEPGSYSWDDLVRDRKTSWDGISNALALKHLRAMKKGDLALIYHTGIERAVIGITQITSDPYPDPRSSDPRLVVVDLKPRQKLAQPVPLDTIKADKVFAGWELVRMGRLSVMPVPPDMWKRIEILSGKKSPPPI